MFVEDNPRILTTYTRINHAIKCLYHITLFHLHLLRKLYLSLENYGLRDFDFDSPLHVMPKTDHTGFDTKMCLRGLIREHPCES